MADQYRFQDINLSFAQRLAEAMQEGHEKYEQGLREWDKDYLHMVQDKALARLNNAIKHLLSLNDVYLAKLRGVQPIAAAEDHLGHAAANLNMLAEWERLGVLPDSTVSPLRAVEQNFPWEGEPVTDAEEAFWRSRGDSETDIAQRIASRGKAK